MFCSLSVSHWVVKRVWSVVSHFLSTRLPPVVPVLGNCVSCLSRSIKENHRNFTKMFIIFTSPKFFNVRSPCLFSRSLSLPSPLSRSLLCVWCGANIFCIQISQVDKVVKKSKKRNETKRNKQLAKGKRDGEGGKLEAKAPKGHNRQWPKE